MNSKHSSKVEIISRVTTISNTQPLIIRTEDLEESKEAKGVVAAQKAKQKVNTEMNKFKAAVVNFERVNSCVFRRLI